MTLWKPVENPCGKPRNLARARLNAFDSNQGESLVFVREAVDALISANEILEARIEALEWDVAHLEIDIALTKETG